MRKPIDNHTLEIFREYARFNAGIIRSKEHDLETAFLIQYQGIKSMPIEENERQKLTLTWASIGLMTYGHTDVIRDAFSYIPPPPFSHEGIRARLICELLIAFLPLPTHLTNDRYIRSKPDEIIFWYDNTEHLLYWDKEVNYFKLQDE